MNTNETAYLLKFRELAATQQKITDLITDLRSICSSLSDWQKVAIELGTSAAYGGTSTVQQWTDHRLGSLAALRVSLIEYYGMTKAVESLWGKLEDEDKVGLVAPDSLKIVHAK